MNVRELKELLADLPDDAPILQETGDHEFYEPNIDTAKMTRDAAYGVVEVYLPNTIGYLALIIR